MSLSIWPRLNLDWGLTEHYYPKADLRETSDGQNMEMILDVPGMKENDIQIETRDGYLIVRGSRKSETERDTGNFHVSERKFGSFERRLRADNLKESDVKKTIDNGVLKLEFPKPLVQKEAPKSIGGQAAGKESELIK